MNTRKEKIRERKSEIQKGCGEQKEKTKGRQWSRTAWESERQRYRFSSAVCTNGFVQVTGQLHPVVSESVIRQNVCVHFSVSRAVVTRTSVNSRTAHSWLRKLVSRYPNLGQKSLLEKTRDKRCRHLWSRLPPLSTFDCSWRMRY